MPALQSRHGSTRQSGRLLADRPKEPGVRALIGGHAGAARFWLVAIALAVSLLPLRNGRQNESWSETARQRDEHARAPARCRRDRGYPSLTQLGPPDLGMALFGLGHPG